MLAYFSLIITLIFNIFKKLIKSPALTLMMNAKLLLKISAIYLLFVVAMSLTSPLLLNAVYTYLTHGSWQSYAYFVGGFVLSYVMAAAGIAIAQNISWLAAAALLAGVLWPWGWAIIAGVFIGL